jgi:hypothetical protein
MKVTSEAIYSKFTELIGGVHNAAYIAVGGRFFKGFAIQGTAFPYVTYNMVSGTQDYTFTTYFETERIQFDIYSNSESSTEAENIFTYMRVLFDFCKLSVAGYDHLWMKRDLSRLLREEDENFHVWHYVVDYMVYTESNTVRI